MILPNEVDGEALATLGVIKLRGALNVCAVKALASMNGGGDEQIGINIIKRASEEPLRQITANAGFEGAIIVEKLMSNPDQNYGFNAATGDYQDLVAAGVIDPARDRPGQSDPHGPPELRPDPRRRPRPGDGLLNSSSAK